MQKKEGELTSCKLLAAVPIHRHHRDSFFATSTTRSTKASRSKIRSSQLTCREFSNTEVSIWCPQNKSGVIWGWNCGWGDEWRGWVVHAWGGFGRRSNWSVWLITFFTTACLGPGLLASSRQPYKLGVFLPINHTTAHNASETMNSTAAQCRAG